MTKILINLVECYKKGELRTPNIQVVNKICSDETINLPSNGSLVDNKFYRALFKNSQLTKIKFCYGHFGLSYFKDCFLENCTFLNIDFSEMECSKCIF